MRAGFYVSIVRGKDYRLLLGPFPDHSDALANVKPCRLRAENNNAKHAFDFFGTVKITADTLTRGVYNVKMQHVWQSYVSKSGKLWDCLGGNLKHVVECAPASGKPYTWVFQTKFGQCETFADARDWVEALAEAYSPEIPADKRWLCPLVQL